MAGLSFTRNILIGVSGDTKEKFIVKVINIGKYLIIGGQLIRKAFYEIQREI